MTFEAEIDALVYALYDLTAEEIALVSGGSASPAPAPALTAPLEELSGASPS